MISKFLSLQPIYRYLAIGIGLLGLFGLGVLYGHKTVEPIVVTKVETIHDKVLIKGDTVIKVVYRDRIVSRDITTIKKKDGTVITREKDKTEDVAKTKDSDQKVTEKKVEDKVMATKTVTPALATSGGGESIGVAVGTILGGVIGFFATGGLGTHAAAALGGAVGAAIGSWIGDEI